MCAIYGRTCDQKLFKWSLLADYTCEKKKQQHISNTHPAHARTHTRTHTQTHTRAPKQVIVVCLTMESLQT